MVIINHFYDEWSRVVFDQILFYDKYPGRRELIIREWRLIKNGRKKYTAEQTKEKQDVALQQFLDEMKLKTVPEELAGIILWEPEFIGDPNFNFNYPNKYVIVNDSGVFRKIHYKTFDHTWTQFDPELDNRELVPKEQRIPFTPPPKKKIKWHNP